MTYYSKHTINMERGDYFVYKTLIVEPQEFCLNSLLHLPVWENDEDGFVCIRTASNGEEALKLMQSMEFDLVLTEINLPIFDGLQLLKQTHQDNHPPLIVFISDIVSFSYAREVFIYGAFDYLAKPVNRESMEGLFTRAARELKKLKQRVHKNTRILESGLHPVFSPNQIAHVISGITRQNQESLEEFRNMLKVIYQSDGSPQSLDIMANKLYTSVVDGIYEKNEWLSLYLPQDFHKRIDYLILDASGDYIDYYYRKLVFLYELICKLDIPFQDKTLAKIYKYLLNNPEEDLKLTSVAAKFYLNHTYLSNLFSKKSSIRYSQLVTQVKIRHAEYLLNYTALSIPDISDQLGYKDVHYFSRLFKSITGKQPTEYTREEYGYSDYSI